MEGAEAPKAMPQNAPGRRRGRERGRGGSAHQARRHPERGHGCDDHAVPRPERNRSPTLKKGDRIVFDFSIKPDGEFQIIDLAPADASVPDRGARK